MEKELVCGIPRLYLEHRLGRGDCTGCQYPTTARIVYEVLDEMGIGDDTILVSSAACGGGIMITSKIDTIQPNHGQGTDAAAAVKHVRPDSIVLAYGGDGDIAAIGCGAFINAAGRADKFTTIMVNNGHYAMTGGQLAPTTLMGQVTTTTPLGRNPGEGYTMHIPEMIATMKGVAYSARGAVHTPAHYQRTKKYLKTALQKQLDNVGFSFLEILSTCPTGWHVSPLESLKWVEEKMIPELPLGEFKNVDRLD